MEEIIRAREYAQMRSTPEYREKVRLINLVVDRIDELELLDVRSVELQSELDRLWTYYRESDTDEKWFEDWITGKDLEKVVEPYVYMTYLDNGITTGGGFMIDTVADLRRKLFMFFWAQEQKNNVMMEAEELIYTLLRREPGSSVED
jgi:hypothetical protein